MSDDAKRALEIRKLELEVAAKEREAAKDAVELEAARVELEQERLKLAADVRAERLDKLRVADRVADTKALIRADRRRTYRFDKTVNGATVQHCMDVLLGWHENDPGCDIRVVFNSPGGSVFDGLELGDFLEWLQREGHRVTTVCAGIAASMAGTLLQYGTTRAITASSYLHLHEVATGSMGKASDLMDTARLAERLTEQIAAKYAGRSGGQHDTASVMDLMRRHEVYLSADEALAHGFVDVIE